MNCSTKGIATPSKISRRIASETQLIWRAAGKPEPCDTAGIPIPPGRNKGQCARCGSEDGVFTRDQVVSTNFVPTKNANRLNAYGRRDGAWHYCRACVFCSKSLRLRCISWFASEVGVQLWRTRPQEKDAPRPDAMASLLDPPAPPFVVGVPLYGIAHGGEAHYHRTWWPGEELDEKPLIRLQSKHVALYSRVAYSRERYPVQVDDAGEFLLQRDSWLRLRDIAERAMRLVIEDGHKPYTAKRAVVDCRLPSRASASLARQWPRLIDPIRACLQASFWPLFSELLNPLETP
jgi:hypothetical protein